MVIYLDDTTRAKANFKKLSNLNRGRAIAAAAAILSIKMANPDDFFTIRDMLEEQERRILDNRIAELLAEQTAG